MQLLRWVTNTKRLPASKQLRATSKFDVWQTYRDTDKGVSFDDCVSLMRSDRAILVAEFSVIARGSELLAERAQSVFDRGGSLMNAQREIVPPDHGYAFILGIMATKRQLSKRMAQAMARRVSHNRIEDERKAAALVFWQDHDLSREQVEKYAGIRYRTMYGWWRHEYPRPDRRGRRKQD